MRGRVGSFEIGMPPPGFQAAAHRLLGWLRRIPKLMAYLLLITWALVEIFPVLFMFYSSLKSHAEIVNTPLSLPTQLHFENYIEAWRGGAIGIPIGRYFMNSVIVVSAALVATSLLATLGGYALSRYRLRGRGSIQSALIIIYAIPIHSLLIPVFLLLGTLHLRNNYCGLILVYTAFELPFGLLLMRSYFDSFPADLEDAAKIDGCSDIDVFRRIVLPLSRGPVAGLSIVFTVDMWSELLFATVIMNQPAMKTLTVGILSYKGLYHTDWPVLMAGLALSSVPAIILFLVFQRQITEGMTLGAFR